MSMQSLILSLLLMVVLLAVSGHCTKCQMVEYANEKALEIKKQIAGARFNFGLKALQLVNKKAPRDDDVFFSPHSLYDALAFAYFGAKGKTEMQLKKTLQLPNSLAMIKVVWNFLDEKKKNKSSSFDYLVATRLYLSEKIPPNQCMNKIFKEQMHPINFRATKPTTALVKINQWVADVTQQNILNFLSESAVDFDTTAVLVNAVFFKGTWIDSFNESLTYTETFHNSLSYKTKATYMKQNGTFTFHNSSFFRANVLRLPYEGHTVSMNIIVPYTRDVDAIVNDLDTSQGQWELRRILDNDLETEYLSLSIPKFKLERDLSVTPLLESFGARGVFGYDADFTRFVNDKYSNANKIHFKDAIHRAKIELNEMGTTAAAATAFMSNRFGGDPVFLEYAVNCPFVFFIYNHKEHSILFSGVYRNAGGEIV